MHQRLSPILAPYKEERGLLISVAQKVAEEFGYLSKETPCEVANHLRLSESKVYSVASSHT